jgi:hypothetical protein
VVGQVRVDDVRRGDHQAGAVGVVVVAEARRDRGRVGAGGGGSYRAVDDAVGGRVDVVVVGGLDVVRVVLAVVGYVDCGGLDWTRGVVLDHGGTRRKHVLNLDV